MSKCFNNSVAVLIAALGIAAAGSVLAGPVAGIGNAHHVTIWVPDYNGHNVYKYTFDYAPGASGSPFSQTVLKLPNPSSGEHCSPNTVAMLGNDLYIVCSGNPNGVNEVLVYDTSNGHFKEPITGISTHGNNLFNNGQLIAILFDNQKNLWLSDVGNHDLLRVPFSELSRNSPKIDTRVIQSPNNPTGLVMDPDDHSFWVAGNDNNGVVLNFPENALNGHSGDFSLNPPTPTFCIANNEPGCASNIPGLFNYPEGIAVFDGAIWVSNNGNNAPGKTIVRLTKDKGSILAYKTFGSALDTPFACPGGMFAVPAPSGGKASLWVNDEGYQVSPHNCSVARNPVGRVFQFLANDLQQHQHSPQPEQFTDWNKIYTGSPGFGGIYVQIE
jgi:hypothetical protein